VRPEVVAGGLGEGPARVGVDESGYAVRIVVFGGVKDHDLDDVEALGGAVVEVAVRLFAGEVLLEEPGGIAEPEEGPAV